jgi:hypothetical protein
MPAAAADLTNLLDRLWHSLGDQVLAATPDAWQAARDRRLAAHTANAGELARLVELAQRESAGWPLTAAAADRLIRQARRLGLELLNFRPWPPGQGPRAAEHDGQRFDGLTRRLRAVAERLTWVRNRIEGPTTPAGDDVPLTTTHAITVMPSANNKAKAKATAIGDGSLSDLAAHPVRVVEAAPVPVFIVPDPNKAKVKAGRPIEHPGVREYVEKLRAGRGLRFWKDLFRECRKRFGDNMPPDARALADYCRPPRVRKKI